MKKVIYNQLEILRKMIICLSGLIKIKLKPFWGYNVFD